MLVSRKSCMIAGAAAERQTLSRSVMPEPKAKEAYSIAERNWESLRHFGVDSGAGITA